MQGLMILRKVRELSPQALEYLATDEGDKSYFPDFVDNDRPRDDAISQELVSATQGFAIADEDGNIYKKFRNLEDAENAKARAVPSFSVELDVPNNGSVDQFEDEEEDEEED